MDDQISLQQVIKSMRDQAKSLRLTPSDVYPELSQPDNSASTFPVDAYPITKKEKQGCVLIMSNGFKQSKKFRNRETVSDIDSERMEKLWKKIGCELFQIPDPGDDGTQPQSITSRNVMPPKEQRKSLTEQENASTSEIEHSEAGQEKNESEIVHNTESGCDQNMPKTDKENGNLSNEKRERKRRKDLQNSIRSKLEYKSNIYKNVTGEEMEELLHSLSETEKNKYDYIVAVINTHGAIMAESEIEREQREVRDLEIEKKIKQTEQVEEGKEADNNSEHVNENKEGEKKEAMAQVFFGNDGKPVRVKKMIEFFYNKDGNYNLDGIPKFFIFDFCRSGPEKQPKADPGSNGVTKEQRPDVAIAPTTMVSDMVIMFATHRDFLAWQDKRGSWLITAISEIFSEYFQTKSVQDMLTKVNMKVRLLCDPEDAPSVFESSLVKEFRLWKSQPTVAPTSDNGTGVAQEADDSEADTPQQTSGVSQPL